MVDTPDLTRVSNVRFRKNCPFLVLASRTVRSLTKVQGDRQVTGQCQSDNYACYQCALPIRLTHHSLVGGFSATLLMLTSDKFG